MVLFPDNRYIYGVCVLNFELMGFFCADCRYVYGVFLYFVDCRNICGVFVYFVDCRNICGIRDNQRSVRRIRDAVSAGSSGSVEEHDAM